MVDENLWDGMSVVFKIDQATLTAILDEGGAIHETDLELTIEDGRTETHFGPDDDFMVSRSRLQYQCFVSVEGHQPGDSKSSMALINISGRHANGQRLTVRGRGWIGRDELGEIEATFDEPPEMIIYPEDYETEEDPVDAEIATMAVGTNVVPLRQEQKGDD